MTVFLLILADISILVLTYVRYQVILHNLARKHGTTVSVLFNSCSNLADISKDKNEMLIMSIISKVITSLSVLSNEYNITETLISFIIFDLILIFFDYYVSEDTSGFYVKTLDEIKLRKRQIKL